MQVRHALPLNDPDATLICVEATNSGRASTIAHEFALELPDRKKIVYLESVIPLALPADLPPGGEVSYYFISDDIKGSLGEHGLPTNTQLRAFVRTGHGVVYAKGKITAI